VMTPVSSMPGWLQTVTLLNPLRYFAELVRGVLLRGAGFAELWPQVAALAGGPAELLPGDTVLEIRPRGVNKGRAVALVSAGAEPGTLFLAMGDDRTDEDLFAALPEGSLAVHVGASPSRAPIRIADVAAARALLEVVAASP